jgi:hypothetical protein
MPFVDSGTEYAYIGSIETVPDILGHNKTDPKSYIREGEGYGE